jgi:hypothetical protein
MDRSLQGFLEGLAARPLFLQARRAARGISFVWLFSIEKSIPARAGGNPVGDSAVRWAVATSTVAGCAPRFPR